MEQCQTNRGPHLIKICILHPKCDTVLETKIFGVLLADGDVTKVNIIVKVIGSQEISYCGEYSQMETNNEDTCQYTHTY